MRRILIALLLVIAIGQGRADTNVLINSDFKDGTANWGGNVRLPKSTDWFNGNTSDAAQDAQSLVMELGQAPSRWLKVWQAFRDPGRTFAYSITYQFSNDYGPVQAPGPAVSDLISTEKDDFVQSIVGFDVKNENQPPTIEEFAVILADARANACAASVVHAPSLSATKRTATGVLNLSASSDGTKKLILVFNAGGKGLIRLLNISLTPSNDLAPPPPL